MNRSLCFLGSFVVVIASSACREQAEAPPSPAPPAETDEEESVVDVTPPAPVDAGVAAVPAPPPAPQEVAAAVRDVGDSGPYFEDRVVPLPPRYPQRAVLYTQENCGFCRKAERWLAKNGVKYDARDIANKENHVAMYKLAPGAGTPVIDWDGTVIRGFKEEKLEQLLFPDGRTKMERVRVRYSESSAPRDLSSLYSYVDDEGSFHIVKSLEEVPKRYRARAKEHASH